MKILSRRDKSRELRRENAKLKEELTATARENIILRCKLEDYEDSAADGGEYIAPCVEAQANKRIAELNAECLRLRCRNSWLEAKQAELERRFVDEMEKRLELTHRYLEIEEALG